MPRIRSLKPDLWDDEALGAVSIEAQCLFIGLITQADDEGKLKGGPARIRALIWPYKPTLDIARVERWLDELTARALVIRYEVDGRQFVALSGWFAHQKISHPAKSALPNPPEPSEVLRPEVEVEVEKETPLSSKLDVAEELFVYWQEKCRHPGAKFTPERRRFIEARMKQGYLPDQIRQAIDGAARAAYVNEATGKRHDDLTLICRNGTYVEDFMGRAEAKPQTGGRLSRPVVSSDEIAAAYGKAA